MSITAVAPQPSRRPSSSAPTRSSPATRSVADGGQVVTNVLVAGDVTSITSFSEHGPHIADGRSDRLVRIQVRAEAAPDDPCANCATSPCVFCRANEAAHRLRHHRRHHHQEPLTHAHDRTLIASSPASAPWR